MLHINFLAKRIFLEIKAKANLKFLEDQFLQQKK